MVLTGGADRVAHADPPEPADGEVWVYKDCVDTGGASLNAVITEEFTINVNFEFDPDDIEDADAPPDLDEDSEFDFTFLLNCDESLDLTTRAEWGDMETWFAANVLEITDASLVITELNVPALVTETLTGCELDQGDIEDALDAVAGFLCTVENEIDLPDLTIEKDCPGGPGESQFSVIVEEVPGGVVDFDNSFLCTEVLLVADLLPGQYLVREIIGGADDFDTVIECNDATGLHDEVGVLIITTLDLEADVLCVITNTLVDEEDDDGLIDINNTNNNIINVNSTNTNENANNNANDNQNNNTNTNTQNQTNDQDQTNNNTQTTNVDSSPEVNISGAGAPSGGGTNVIVSAPSTGDGGLLGLQRESTGYVTWGAVGGVLALVLSAAAARYVRSER
jgi:hypothetical protein